MRAKLPTGQAGELAAAAADGIVVARVDGISPGDLRELAIAVRQQAGVEIVVLGGISDTGGVSLVAAVTPASRGNGSRKGPAGNSQPLPVPRPSKTASSPERCRR